jgi:hypothetical protein
VTRTVVRETPNPTLTFALHVHALMATHKAGRRTILTRSDAQRAIRTFIVDAKLLPTVPYHVDCPGDLDLTLSKRGTCAVRVEDKAVHYDLWIDDDARQLRIGGHGFAIETYRLQSAISAEVQRRMPRTDVSPYDVNCGDADVLVIQPDSRVPCEFTIDGMLIPFAIHFGDFHGHLQVEMLHKP